MEKNFAHFLIYALNACDSDHKNPKYDSKPLQFYSQENFLWNSHLCA